MLRASLMVLAALATTPGCGPSATEGGFESANSAARMYAAEQAARSGDRTAVHDLIELLDSDDPAVRFLAISSLERLTGETFGYRHYDPAIDRRDAIKRWTNAYTSGAIQPIVTSPASTPAVDAAAPVSTPVNATSNG